MDRNIEDYLKDPNITGIMNAVSGKFINAIDHHDISSISMCTLMRCVERYDPTKGAKFTSYLYQQLVYAYKNELKKKKPEFSCDTIEKSFDMQSKNEVYEILESIPENMKKIIQQKFYYDMSFKEIAQENGYSRETARRRFQKAMKLCKKIAKT